LQLKLDSIQFLQPVPLVAAEVMKDIRLRQNSKFHGVPLSTQQQTPTSVFRSTVAKRAVLAKYSLTLEVDEMTSRGNLRFTSGHEVRFLFGDVSCFLKYTLSTTEE
jgi:hypothetical protein